MRQKLDYKFKVWHKICVKVNATSEFLPNFWSNFCRIELIRFNAAVIRLYKATFRLVVMFKFSSKINIVQRCSHSKYSLQYYSFVTIWETEPLFFSIFSIFHATLHTRNFTITKVRKFKGIYSRKHNYKVFRVCLHCVKNIQIRSFFWSLFSRIPTEYVETLVSLHIQSECRKIRTRKKVRH